MDQNSSDKDLRCGCGRSRRGSVAAFPGQLSRSAASASFFLFSFFCDSRNTGRGRVVFFSQRDTSFYVNNNKVETQVVDWEGLFSFYKGILLSMSKIIKILRAYSQYCSACDFRF